MDKESQSLKDMIDLFLRDSTRVIERIKENHSEPEKEDLEEISQRVWDLHHFATKLLETKPSESVYYNARIVKEIVEERLNNPDTSLLAAADSMKRDSDITPMRIAIENLAKEERARCVLFENLTEISQDLAA